MTTSKNSKALVPQPKSKPEFIRLRADAALKKAIKDYVDANDEYTVSRLVREAVREYIAAHPNSEITVVRHGKPPKLRGDHPQG
jgi:hypothetical protein